MDCRRAVSSPLKTAHAGPMSERSIQEQSGRPVAVRPGPETRVSPAPSALSGRSWAPHTLPPRTDPQDCCSCSSPDSHSPMVLRLNLDSGPKAARTHSFSLFSVPKPGTWLQSGVHTRRHRLCPEGQSQGTCRVAHSGCGGLFSGQDEGRKDTRMTPSAALRPHVSVPSQEQNAPSSVQSRSHPA